MLFVIKTLLSNWWRDWLLFRRERRLNWEIKLILSQIFTYRERKFEWWRRRALSALSLHAPHLWVWFLTRTSPHNYYSKLTTHVSGNSWSCAPWLGLALLSSLWFITAAFVTKLQITTMYMTRDQGFLSVFVLCLLNKFVFMANTKETSYVCSEFIKVIFGWMVNN